MSLVLPNDQALESAQSWQHFQLLGCRVHPTTKATALARILDRARQAEGGYICFAEAHMLMEARKDRTFRDVVNGAVLATTDGTPVRWMARARGHAYAETVDGPGMTPRLLEACAEQGLAVGFYGGTEETLLEMQRRLRNGYPTLQVAYAYSPPFRELTPLEDRAIVEDIEAAGVDLLFVGLGCPKQERWMAAHAGQLRCMQLGVGAVFEFLAGHRKMPPAIVQRAGFTWLYRTVQEPRRLARRTLHDLPCFMVLALGELLFRRAGSKSSTGTAVAELETAGKR